MVSREAIPRHLSIGDFQVKISCAGQQQVCDLCAAPGHIARVCPLRGKCFQYFDILGLNETRLDNTIADRQIDIEGYDILRRDRNRNGGGVAFYVAQSLTYVNHS